MSTVAIDADGFQVARWEITLPWTPDDDLPLAADFDVEPDWDAAFDPPSPEDREWWARECDERERREQDGPSDRDWDEYQRLSVWQDRVEQMHLISDIDIEAAGLAVG
jgi:hypothetical protein